MPYCLHFLPNSPYAFYTFSYRSLPMFLTRAEQSRDLRYRDGRLCKHCLMYTVKRELATLGFEKWNWLCAADSSDYITDNRLRLGSPTVAGWLPWRLYQSLARRTSAGVLR